MALKIGQGSERVSLLTPVQRDFLAADRSEARPETFDYLNLKRGENDDCSACEGIELGDGDAWLSESESFENAVCVPAGARVKNLKCGTRYFARTGSERFSFETENACPRFMSVEGMTNVRDCGGWTVVSGQRVRQGLLYRGSEMNSHVTVTERGLETLRAEMRIKSVLDLRGSTERVENVYGGRYLNVPALAYAQWFEHPDSAREIFEFLFEPSNYPVYFHCWGGADRTGTLAFLLGALLGEQYEDLIDDYEITSLSIWGVRSRNSDLWQGFEQVFNALPGETIQAKAEHHVLSCGVSRDGIERFRRFMLERREA